MSDDEMTLFKKAVDIERMIVGMEELNAQDSPLRSRQLSLAITKMEEAKFWLSDYLATVSERA